MAGKSKWRKFQADTSSGGESDRGIGLKPSPLGSPRQLPPSSKGYDSNGLADYGYQSPRVLLSSNQSGVPRITVTEPTPPIETDTEAELEPIAQLVVIPEIDIKLSYQVPNICIPRSARCWRSLNKAKLCEILGIDDHEYEILSCAFASLLGESPELQDLSLKSTAERKRFVDSLNGMLAGNILGQTVNVHQYWRKIESRVEEEGEAIVGYALYRVAIRVKRDMTTGQYDYLNGLFSIATGDNRSLRFRRFLSPPGPRSYSRQVAPNFPPNAYVLSPQYRQNAPHYQILRFGLRVVRGLFFCCFGVVALHICLAACKILIIASGVDLSTPDCQREQLMGILTEPWNISLGGLLNWVFANNVLGKMVLSGLGFFIGRCWSGIRRTLRILMIFLKL
ncbi:hypothetical protein H072_2426 [Dactylellina haptotyla CBS 200.50]|uniref:Uncharacterized protein n=1 Tax=Dactylellina haptotyla (strain CBS 200.50) TaxID=1284197 RepID=S8C7D2_DACHA|nr:hypothetical protein H072_2426 [Dactylellina haptotyla CBS 200.50]